MNNGELNLLIESINFRSKDELIKKLRDMRDSTSRLAPAERGAIKQMIGIGIQQACYCTEKELLRYKAFLEDKKSYKKAKENSDECA